VLPSSPQNPTPFVSVIVPAYNEERFLPQCLDSLACVDYPREKLEVIVVDNGSTDATREIAEGRGARVLRDDSRNVSGLRNLGAKAAGGEILAFVDADCVVSPRWLKAAQKYFHDPEVAAWGSPPVVPEDATWVQKAWFLVRRKEKPVQEVDWLETMNLFVRREAFAQAGGFDEGLVTCEDADFCYRLENRGKIVSDEEIEVTHFGEAATLKDFLRKEMWRGRSNLKGLRAHGFRWKELPSLAVPVYFRLFLPLLFLLSAVVFSPWLLVSFFLAWELPSLLALRKVKRKKATTEEIPPLLLLLQIYFFARTAAIFGKGRS